MLVGSLHFVSKFVLCCFTIIGMDLNNVSCIIIILCISIFVVLSRTWCLFGIIAVVFLLVTNYGFITFLSVSKCVVNGISILLMYRNVFLVIH